MKNKKGFTLTELIVVIAIIGILLAVLVPTWSYFIMRANVKSQNNYSKVIFNAAQTQATREKFYERSVLTGAKEDLAANKTSDASSKLATLLIGSACKETGKDANGNNVYSSEVCIYWDGHDAKMLDPDTNAELAATTYNAAELQHYIDAVNKVFSHSGETVYKIYIKDYIVQSVCSGRSEGTANIGSYPVNQDGRSDDTVPDFNMKDIVLTPAS